MLLILIESVWVVEDLVVGLSNATCLSHSWGDWPSVSYLLKVKTRWNRSRSNCCWMHIHMGRMSTNSRCISCCPCRLVYVWILYDTDHLRAVSFTLAFKHHLLVCKLIVWLVIDKNLGAFHLRYHISRFIVDAWVAHIHGLRVSWAPHGEPVWWYSSIGICHYFWLVVGKGLEGVDEVDEFKTSIHICIVPLDPVT